MKRAIVIIAGLLLAIGVTAYVGWRMIVSPLGGDEPRWIYFPQGMNRAQVKAQLREDFGRWGDRVYMLWSAMASDSATVRGAYRFDPGTAAKSAAARLYNSRQTPVRLTFNNVRTLPDLAASVGRQMEFAPEDFLAACDSVLPDAGFKRKEEYIAAFLPDTYEFYWTSTPAQTIGRLLEYRNRFWTDDRRSRAASLGLTPVQAATIASIAEEETNSADERPVVARLYLNRFQRGMRLQADPTVKFAVGDFSLRRILNEHLQTPSPYNTYLNAGLPPGPIRLAEARTINGLLTSHPHNYIYMCAKPDFSGRHNFTASYAEHQRNAAAYRKALNNR